MNAIRLASMAVGRRWASAVMVGLLLGACGGWLAGCAAHSARRQSAEAELRAATQQYGELVAKMDHAAIAALFTPDGEVEVAGQPPVVGRDAIRKQLESFAAYHVESEQITADTVTTGDDRGTVRGTYHQRVRTPSGQVVEVHGTYVADWRRLADGWHIQRISTRPQR